MKIWRPSGLVFGRCCNACVISGIRLQLFLPTISYICLQLTQISKLFRENSQLGKLSFGKFVRVQAKRPFVGIITFCAHFSSKYRWWWLWFSMTFSLRYHKYHCVHAVCILMFNGRYSRADWYLVHFLMFCSNVIFSSSATYAGATADGQPPLCFCRCSTGSRSWANRLSTRAIRGRNSGADKGPLWFAYLYCQSHLHLLLKPSSIWLPGADKSQLCVFCHFQGTEF